MTSKRPHIAFFNRAFYPEVSATGQLLTELAEDLAQEHKAQVTVVAGMPLGMKEPSWLPPREWHLFYRERYGPVEILRARGTAFSKKTFIGRFVNYLSFFCSACLAGFSLKRPDVVIALTDPPIIGLAAYLSAKRFRSRFILSFRDLFPEAGRLLEDFRSPFVEWVLDRVNHFLIRKADRIVVLGEAMRRRLIEEKGADPAKVVVIPDWADCSAIVPSEKRNRFSETHGLADSFVVMHSGNLGLSQGVETLLEAAQQLKDLPDLKFVFIGDGVKKPQLVQKVREEGLSHVEFLPFQPKEELCETFASADCFLVSLKPGLAGVITPSKLYSILAAGRPYVACVDEECDVARITRTYGCGLLSRPGDPHDLSDKIRLLYQDRSLAQQLGEKARRASSFFDRSVGVKAYWQLCCELFS